MYAVLHACNWRSKNHRNPQYTPKAFAFPNAAIEDYLQQAIGDIIVIMKEPPKRLHFLYYGEATENVINRIAHILHRSTSQPRLQIVPLPPLLLLKGCFRSNELDK